jgi:hypothetical protein
MNAKEHTAYKVIQIIQTAIACALIGVCWGEEGWVFNAGILYAGMILGSLFTEAMNEGE